MLTKEYFTLNLKSPDLVNNVTYNFFFLTIKLWILI